MEELIADVEEKWLDILFGFCKETFKGLNLPSHDHMHHLRVWYIAKELFHELQKQGMEINSNDLEKTIVAAFFHDIGMVKSLESNHGKLSKEMCESFFDKNGYEIEGFQEVLDAIEKHDDKEYKSMVYHDKLQKNVLSVLCVSDDLDAFGAIGVFRYLEIYLMRNIPVHELPKLILKNVKNRYGNFHNLYSNLDEFTKKEKEKFDYITKFYQELEDEIENYSKDNYKGPVGVINFFIKYTLDEPITMDKIYGVVSEQSTDNYVLDFFKRFNEELNVAHMK